MDIANLLAQGTRARPAGMEQNALMQYQQFQDAKLRNALMQTQMQAAQEKQAQDRQNALLQQNFINSIPSPQMQASQSALAGGGGPTVANAAQMKPVDPRLQMLHQAMQARMVSPVDYISAAMPAAAKPEYKVVGDALVSVGPGGVKEAYKSAPKEQTPSDWKLYQLSGAEQRGMTFDQWDTNRRKAGAANVSLSTGQKGYENESKLRNDFKSEPIYKDFQDMDQAYKQIKSGLSAKSPIGDVAAATKIMKLLDPGSVVRESELGIAMTAAGKFDRLQNYVQMKISGESLTPKQRQDFEALAGELHAAAAQAYNAKRDEYANMGKRYGLDETVLGAKSPTVAKPVQSASPKAGDVIDGYRFKGGNPADKANWERK